MSIIVTIKNYFKFNKSIQIKNKYEIIGYNIIGMDDDVQITKIMKDEMVELIKSFDMFLINSKNDFHENYKNRESRLKYISIILRKIGELHSLAEKNVIYKKDYKKIKYDLFVLLCSYFGSLEDVKVLEETVCALENDGLLPENSFDRFMLITPIGRWS